MRSTRLARLTLVASGLAVLTPAALAQDDDHVVLIGLVRDFRTDHADFGVTPALGAGHVAGNVATTLGDKGRPELGPDTGFQVTSPWHSTLGNPIAPHMFWVGPDCMVPVVQGPVILNKSYVDSFDASLGAYGGTNIGGPPDFVEGAQMPILVEPTDFPPPIVEWRRDANGETSVLDEDLDCQRFIVGNHHTVVVEGDVRILCRDEFLLMNWSRIELAPGARLTVYARNTVTMQDQCYLGDPEDISRARFYVSGTEPVIIQNQCAVYALVVAPDAQIQVLDGSDFYGSYMGDGVSVANQSGFHATGLLPSACGYTIFDSPGVPGLYSHGDITSADSFDSWYRHVPGANAAMHIPITLYPDGTGFYVYDEDEFYPIDGELYGNEGQQHNKNFTFFIAADFTYHGCQDQILELQGSDDIWAYIDDRLMIDLGGIDPSTPQIAEVDRLSGLVDGETYTIRIYFAHRSSSTPKLRIRTNLDLHYNPLAADLPAFAGHD